MYEAIKDVREGELSGERKWGKRKEGKGKEWKEIRKMSRSRLGCEQF